MRSPHPVSSWCRSCWKRAPQVAVVKVVSLFFFSFLLFFYFEDETLWSHSGGMVCSSTSRQWHGLKPRGRSRRIFVAADVSRWFRRDVHRQDSYLPLLHALGNSASQKFSHNKENFKQNVKEQSPSCKLILMASDIRKWIEMNESLSCPL